VHFLLFSKEYLESAGCLTFGLLLVRCLDNIYISANKVTVARAAYPIIVLVRRAYFPKEINLKETRSTLERL
jgi:hypothetical protein